MDDDAIKTHAFDFVEAFVDPKDAAAVLWWAVGLAHWLVGRGVLVDPDD